MRLRSIGIGIVATLVALCYSFLLSTADAQELNSPIGANHVLLIGFDGYGGHYVHWDELPNLSRFKEKGAWTLKKRSVIPSSSALNWATILMGTPSEIHGFRTWGSKAPDIPSATLTEDGLFPDIFYLTRQVKPDAKLYCVYSWDGIGYLFDKKVMTEEESVEDDEKVLEVGMRYIAENPTLAFIYFHQPDITGHGVGWGTPEYYAAVRHLDEQAGKILDYLEANDRLKDTVVILTSDHGGSEKGHGGESMEHMEAPFYLYGCGVKPGEITDVVAGYDVGATIAWILGIDPPQAWRGKPITSAFGK